LVLLLAEHHGFEALPDGGKSQKTAEASPDSSGEASIILCDLPPTATLRPRFDSANVSTLNQMLANILNPNPDGFPLLISL